MIASTGDPDTHGDGLRALGAHEVIAGPELVSGPVNGVVDLVGGPQLVQAFGTLAEHGTLIAVGNATEQPASFRAGSLFGDQGRHDRSIVTFFLVAGHPLGPDLTWLAERVAAGVLDPQISWRGSWHQAEEAVTALLERRLHGKAVLDIA